SEGRLQQVGTPQAVYERPTNLFVARFIGSPPMNTVDGVMASEAGEPVVRVGTSTFPAGAAGVERLEDGRRVVLGIRPEHLSLGDGPVKANVHTVEWLGHERHLICDIGGSMVIVREPSDGATVKAGEAVALTADP